MIKTGKSGKFHTAYLRADRIIRNHCDSSNVALLFFFLCCLFYCLVLQSKLFHLEFICLYSTKIDFLWNLLWENSVRNVKKNALKYWYHQPFPMLISKARAFFYNKILPCFIIFWKYPIWRKKIYCFSHFKLKLRYFYTKWLSKCG